MTPAGGIPNTSRSGTVRPEIHKAPARLNRTIRADAGSDHGPVQRRRATATSTSRRGCDRAKVQHLRGHFDFRVLHRDVPFCSSCRSSHLGPTCAHGWGSPVFSTFIRQGSAVRSGDISRPKLRRLVRSVGSAVVVVRDRSGPAHASWVQTKRPAREAPAYRSFIPEPAEPATSPAHGSIKARAWMLAVHASTACCSSAASRLRPMNTSLLALTSPACQARE